MRLSLNSKGARGQISASFAIVEHLQRLGSMKLGNIKKPEEYFFSGATVERRVDESGRIRLPDGIVSQIRKYNYDYGYAEGEFKAVFMTPTFSDFDGYLCYSPSKILSIDEKRISDDDYQTLLDIYCITSKGIIASDGRLTLPRRLNDARKVIVKPDKEFFILERVE